MYQLRSFQLRDMTACGAALRRLSAGATSLEEVADRLVRHLYTSLTIGQQGEPACSLIRLFTTTRYDLLPSDLRALADQRLGDRPAIPSLTCLTLLASAGTLPEWNDPARSSHFRIIPLGRPEDVEQLPMFSQLFRQLGVSLPQLAQPTQNVLLDTQEQTFNVFHISHAENNPHVPAQEEFVLKYGIRSVLGFGAPLPNGELFSIILFSKDFIPARTAQLFKPLALCAKIALAPFASTTPTPRPSAAPMSIADQRHADSPSASHLQTRIAELEQLLTVHEQTVDAQADRMELIVQGSQMGTWRWDLVSGRQDWSDEQCRIFGLDPSQAVPTHATFLAALHRDDAEGVQQAVEAALKHNRPYHIDCRILRPSGEVRHIDCRGTVRRGLDGQPLSMAGTVLDVTDYKRAEYAWRDSEIRMRSIFESAIEGIVVIDEQGRIESTNAALLNMFGYQAHELAGQNISLLMPAPCREQHARDLTDYLAAENEMAIGSGREVPAVRKDGTLIEVHVSVSEMQIGTTKKYTGMLRDISERKRMEESLRESEERFRQLAEHIDAVFWLTSPDKSQILYLSPAFETVWECPRDLLYENPKFWLDYVHPEDRTRVATAAACQAHLPYDEEYRIVTPGGRVRWIRDRSVAIKNLDGEPYRIAGIAVDITVAKQMEAQVRASERRHRALVEWSPHAIFVNCEDKIVFANQACVKLFGAIAPSQLFGKSLFDVVHPDSQARVQQSMTTLRAASQAPPLLEERFVGLDGSLIEVELAVVPIMFEDKPAFQVIATDIRARKNLEEALVATNLQLQTILSSATNVSIIATNTEGTITTFNTGAEALLGYAASEMIGRHSLASLHLPEEIDLRAKELSDLYNRPIQGIEALIEQARRGEFDEREWTYQRKDGSRSTILLTITALRDNDGAMTGFLAIGKDITGRKAAENALAQAARDLERKNIELAHARDEALRAVQLKADFLATMSHEIRTPMNAIIGMTGLLLDTPLTKEQHEFADAVRRSGDGLLTLVNDILDFSKIEAGKLHFEQLPFDLRMTVEDTMELLAEQAQRKGLELIGLVDATVPTGVIGDPGRLRQILINLIGNAIKFTATGEVFLQVTCDRHDGAALLRFTITDTGIGISAEAQTRLFQAFVQADSSTTRRFGGTGLGLAICQRLVAQMHGQIGIESRPGHGSTFWFTARFQETALATSHPVVAWNHLRGRRILLVDQNKTVRQALRKELTAHGVDCVGAESGREALELAHAAAAMQKPFDLALIESHLSESDGFETARLLKQDPATADMRLVILTTIGRRGDGHTAHTLGIDAYLTKPLRQAQLLECLCLLLCNRAAVETPAHAEVTPLMTRHTLAETETATKPCLLLAEDNPVNQKVACKMLEKLGYRVDVASNGQEAVAAHERSRYPLIFMDCQMPDVDGFEATALIRKMEGRSAHTPIVAMTANAMQGDRERCLAAGMDDYVAKPIRPKDLQMVLDTWLHKRNQAAAS
ncbi:MAG: PAS domain S-box protein [Nitrospira sp.]|nr:PAS domain S-box protein [Nitrospira sp.]